MRFLFIICLFISCSSEPDNADRTGFYKQLIEMLVVGETEFEVNEITDPFGEGIIEVKTVKRTQLWEAHLELRAAGKDAWPVLFEHLDDKRPSDAARQVMAPHDVGHQCYYILYYQVIDMPKGFWISRGMDVFDDFKPTIKEWLLERSHKSLNEIRLEVCLKTLVIQKNSKFLLKLKGNSINLLEKEIIRLEEVIKKEKREGVSTEFRSKLISEQLKHVGPKLRFKDRDFDFALDYVSRFTPHDNSRDKIKYLFLFDTKEIPKIKLNIYADNLTAGEILKRACKAAGVTWEIGGATIILRKNRSLK